MGNPNKHLYIKFSQRFSEDAHRAAFEPGFVLKLYAVNEVYGWFTVVMECLQALWLDPNLDYCTCLGWGFVLHECGSFQFILLADRDLAGKGEANYLPIMDQRFVVQAMLE